MSEVNKSRRGVPSYALRYAYVSILCVSASDGARGADHRGDSPGNSFESQMQPKFL